MSQSLSLFLKDQVWVAKWSEEWESEDFKKQKQNMNAYKSLIPSC